MMQIQTPLIFVTSESADAVALAPQAPPADLESALEHCLVDVTTLRHITSLDPDGRAQINAFMTSHPQARIIAVGVEAQRWLTGHDIGHSPMYAPDAHPVLKNPERLAVHLGAVLGHALANGRQKIDWTRAERDALLPTDQDPHLSEKAILFAPLRITAEAIANQAMPLDQPRPDALAGVEEKKGRRKSTTSASLWKETRHMVVKDIEAMDRLGYPPGMIPNQYPTEPEQKIPLAWREDYRDAKGNPKTNLYQPVMRMGEFVFYINPNDHPPAHLHVYSFNPVNGQIRAARLAFIRTRDEETLYLVPYYYSSMFRAASPGAGSGSPKRYIVSEEPVKKEYLQRFDFTEDQLNRVCMIASANADLLMERYQELRLLESKKRAHLSPALVENDYVLAEPDSLHPGKRVRYVGYQERLMTALPSLERSA
jgi:hypothetical protein